MSSIRYNEATNTLLKHVPELRTDYELERQNWAPDDVHPHVVFGSVMAKFIDRTELAWRGTNDEKYECILQRAFSLVEDLVSSSDFESRCLIDASLLETLLGESDGWARYSGFFKPNTLKLAKRVVERFAG